MQNIVSSVVSKYGGQIVEQSLQSCLFHIPTFLYPDIAELWWSIIQRDRQVSANAWWLQKNHCNFLILNVIKQMTYQTFHNKIT